MLTDGDLIKQQQILNLINEIDKFEYNFLPDHKPLLQIDIYADKKNFSIGIYYSIK